MKQDKADKNQKKSAALAKANHRHGPRGSRGPDQRIGRHVARRRRRPLIPCHPGRAVLEVVPALPVLVQIEALLLAVVRDAQADQRIDDLRDRKVIAAE